MKIAPIQLGLISFRRVSVELDERDLPENTAAPTDVVFDFENVIIGTHVGLSPMEDDDRPGKNFFLILQVKVENKPSKEKDTRFSPYRLDIEAGASVKALPGAEALGDINDLVAVNGTGLLWSAIREQVTSLTARMPAGPVILPTVNFRDLRQKKADAGVAEPARALAKAPRKRKPSRG